MKKYRQGSKIVDIVKQRLKILDKVTKNTKRIPVSKYKTTRKSNRNAIPDTVRKLEQSTSKKQCINDQKVLVDTPEHEIAYEVTIFRSSSSSPPFTAIHATDEIYCAQDTILDNCVRPASSMTLLNDDLYLTDFSDEYIPQDDATSSSSSDNSVKPIRKSANNAKKTRNKNSRKPSDVAFSGSGNVCKGNSKTAPTNVAGTGFNVSGQQNHKRGRRQAVPDLWKKNIRKNNRQRGEPYVSAKGVLMPGKTLKESKCMGRCIHLCTSKFSEEERLKIFSSFWNIGSVEQKRLYIVNLIQREKTRAYKRKHSRKKLNSKYFLEKIGTTEKIRVCQKFFVATLDVSETFVRFCFKKVIDNTIVVGDKRGKHAPHNKKPYEIREHVRNHIKSFPRMPPPRGHKDTKKEYLARNLNLTKMYNLYRMKCEREQRESVELAYYRSVFNKDFNIGFHRPGRDICETCSSFEKMDDKQKEEQKGIHEEHLKRIAAASQHNEEANRLAQSGEIHFAEYDLKAICDCAPSSSRLKRVLPVYNFTVLDYGEVNLNVLCYCWHEGMARKGATEIGSCLYKYLQSNADGKPITFMSDTCASQCRNMYISSLLLYCIEMFDIPEINQKYFEPGHSQMETDDIHANIEKAKKYLAVRDHPGFYNLIRNSLWNYSNSVYEMGKDDFIDLKYLKNILVKNAKIDQRGEPVNWYNIRWLQYRKEDPTHIYFKYDLDDTIFNKIEVIRRGKRLQSCKDIVLLKKVYDGPLPFPGEY